MYPNQVSISFMTEISKNKKKQFKIAIRINDKGNENSSEMTNTKLA
jgi:hypothetical protein